MKRVLITIDPSDIPLSPVYEAIAMEPGVEEAYIVNWNVATPPMGFLLRIHGTYEQLDSVIADDPNVSHHEILPIRERECYCYLAGESTAGERALFENFTQGSLLTVPPITIHADTSSTFTLIGNSEDIQAAVEGVPDAVDVTVEEVGGERVAADSVVGALAPRQREAIEVALELGYYHIPRDGTIDDVAEALDCATATAAEHLQKAEAKVLSTLFGVRE